MEGFPLIAIIGLSRADIFMQANQNALIYYGIAGGLLLVILAAIWFGAARDQKFKTATYRCRRQMRDLKPRSPRCLMDYACSDRDQKLIVRNENNMAGCTASRPNSQSPARRWNRSQGRHLRGHHFADSESYVGALRELKTQGGAAEYVTYNHVTGKIYAVDRRPLPDGGWIAIHQDVTAQKRTEAEITHLAHYDSLTSLANRVCFLKHVGQAAEKNSQTHAQFAIHLLDLDRFKEVNDTLGHATGDRLLKAVALRLAFAVGGDNLVARLGGDEFAVLQNIDTEVGKNEVARLAECILTSIRAPFELDGQQITIETSIGVALMPEHGTEAEQLLKNADLALQGKSEGRIFFASSKRASNARRRTAAPPRRTYVQRSRTANSSSTINRSWMSRQARPLRWKPGAMETSRAWACRARRIHPDCRRYWPHRATRRMGDPQGVRRRSLLAGTYRDCD